MKKRGFTGLLLLCVLTPAGAQSPHEWGGALGLTSDYVVRGVSQTRGEPAVQADVHWTYASRLSVGAWGSTIDPNAGPGPNLELNFYAALAQQFGGDWVARLVATRYVYPSDAPGRSWDYDELAGSISFRDWLVARATWSPNASAYRVRRYGGEADVASYELSAHVPWRHGWTFSAGAGYYDLSNLLNRSYHYWSASATYARDRWHLNFARLGTSGAAREIFGPQAADDRWSVEVQWRFQGSAF